MYNILLILYYTISLYHYSFVFICCYSEYDICITVIMYCYVNIPIAMDSGTCFVMHKYQLAYYDHIY